MSTTTHITAALEGNPIVAAKPEDVHAKIFRDIALKIAEKLNDEKDED